MTTASSPARSEGPGPGGLRGLVRRLAPEGSARRHLAKIAASRPASLPLAVARSVVTSARLTGLSSGLSCVVYPGARVRIVRRRGARVELAGKLVFRPFLQARDETRIVLDRDSCLRVEGDLELGSGVALVASPRASIVIGGRQASSGAGFSADSLIFARERVEIGADSIVAWGCNIVDSDWHQLEGSPMTVPVKVGAACWIGHGVSVLKGATIPDGCVVGARSVVGRGTFPAGSLLAGVPAKLRKEGVSWTR